MLKQGFKSLNRCSTSRRTLSSYNNGASRSTNTSFTPLRTCRSRSVGNSSRMFNSSSPSPVHSRAQSPVGSPEASPLAMLMGTMASQLLQQLQMLELHLDIRVSILALINGFSQKPIPDVSLNDLLKFKDFTPLNREANSENLIENANFALSTLLILNCKRLKEFKQLPYICIVNPNIATIFRTYITSLEKILDFINENCDVEYKDQDVCQYYQDFKIRDLQTNSQFLEVLKQILEIHSDNLPILSEGFKDISLFSLLENDQVFLDNHLKERIMLRLISKHHLLLSEHFEEYSKQNALLSNIRNIGMIDKDLDVIHLIRQVSDFVNDMSSLKYDEKISIEFETIVLDESSTKVNKFDSNSKDDVKINFPYVSSHLEYVLQEILKNSSRAQIENKVRKPINITIVLNKTAPQSYLELRIRDQGKGITSKSLVNLFTYSFTTVTKTAQHENDNYEVFNNGAGTDANIIAGMGYGLPLSKLYVEMFGGDLDLQTYEGWGTDVYIKLKGPESKLLG